MPAPPPPYAPVPDAVPAPLRRILALLSVLCTALGLCLACAASEAPVPTPAEAAATPVFPKQHATNLMVELESIMITGAWRELDNLIWDGLDPALKTRWRTAMKHEFQQITYKEKYTTSMYDYRLLSSDDLAGIPELPKTLPPGALIWAVRVDIDYRYRPKSRAAADASASAATPVPNAAASSDSATGPIPDADSRDEQATVCFYLIESGGDVRILGSDRDFFMQFGQALPRGLIGTWAIGLITFFLVLVFWVTMASHCWAARPKLRLWRWITLALPLLGALAYFFWVYWRKPRRPLISLSMLANLRSSGLRAAIQADLTSTPGQPAPQAAGAAPPPPAPADAPAAPATAAAPLPVTVTVTGPDRSGPQ